MILRAGTYYTDFRFAGKRIRLSTGATTKPVAARIAREIEATMRDGRIPGLLAKLAARQSLNVGSILDQYQAAGCPRQGIDPRTDKTRLAREIKYLREYWGNRQPDDIRTADCDGYHVWRCKLAAATGRGPGGRACEIELATLSGVLTWAVRGRMIDRNHLATGRQKYSRNVRHCREFMPAGADELHLLARTLFDDTKTEVLGWQLLIEALTGLRSSEACALRWQPAQAGSTAAGHMDGKFLCVARLKRGVNPYIRLDDPMRSAILPMLDALRRWHDSRAEPADLPPIDLATNLTRNPSLDPHTSLSGWYLPNRFGGGHVCPSALGRALAPVCARLGLPARHSHGMRAYYVTVRRCQGIADSQIAWELGQGSGPELIRKVYGEIPPNWSGLVHTFTWLPTTGRAAWETETTTKS